eukprot:scaffold181212_cov19-Tisochrysis_lutea.AAC.1
MARGGGQRRSRRPVLKGQSACEQAVCPAGSDGEDATSSRQRGSRHAKHCSFSYSDWASIEQMNQRKWRVTQAEHAEANGWVRHQKLCTPPPAAAAAATADDDGNDDDGAGASGADHSAKSMMLRVSGSNASFLVVQAPNAALHVPHWVKAWFAEPG